MIKMLMFSVSMFMTMTKNQMVTVVVIIMSCVFMSALMFLLSLVHWFSLLVLLIYISGVMVLFMFVVSMTPNEKAPVKSNKKTFFINLLLISIFYVKLTYSSENFKFSSSMEWNLNMMAAMATIIMLMGYMPPKTINSFYSGMKSTK